MNIITLFLMACLATCLNSTAQPYVEGGKTRHRFAQLNLGLDQKVFFGSGSMAAVADSSGILINYELNNQYETRLIIGGTHFWGHADFYIAIPLFSLGKSGFSTGVETGAKYFPWRIEYKKFRPYMGVSMLPTRYQQGRGAEMIRFSYPLSAGLVYCRNDFLIELNMSWHNQKPSDYYISSTVAFPVQTQLVSASLGLKFMLDATLSAEKDWLSGKTTKLTDTLASLNRLNGLTLAVGPSSSFFLKTSPHNNQIAPFADQHKSFGVFPEFGIGYYLHKPDVQFNLSYRNMKNEIEAYHFTQTAIRKALTLESFKFLIDYHGFALFAGLNLSYEQFSVHEKKYQNLSTGTFDGIKPGITFGWDIRPNRLQTWYLRTNLRYFPNLFVTMPGGGSVHFEQLEFNFIQLVVFPGRMF